MNHIEDKKFFITGGGTGGHIYPAVSIINTLIELGAQKKNIFYTGNKKNLEYKIALENDYNFLSENVSGMPRKLSFKFIIWLFNLIYSIFLCFTYFLKYKPDVVFATGGYVSAPVLFVSRFLKVPYVLHDSDCKPGIVTRTFANKAYAVNLAFDNANQYVKSKNIKNFSNPVRKAFFEIEKDEARKQLNLGNEFVILIMGGSQGAKTINSAAIELMKKYCGRDDIKIILQTGRKNYDEIINEFTPPKNAIIAPYFDNMEIPITASDIIVSRAGSISISEILSSKTPSILVPYPYAAANHQRINAKAIVNQNAALYLEDDTLKEGALIKAIDDILADKEKYNTLLQNAKRLSVNYDGANINIANLILEAI